MSEASDPTAKPVLQAHLVDGIIRAKWPGKRWHGRYKSIYEACEAAQDDGIKTFIIDYVDEET